MLIIKPNQHYIIRLMPRISFPNSPIAECVFATKKHKVKPFLRYKYFCYVKTENDIETIRFGRTIREFIKEQYDKNINLFDLKCEYSISFDTSIVSFQFTKLDNFSLVKTGAFVILKMYDNVPELDHVMEFSKKRMLSFDNETIFEQEARDYVKAVRSGIYVSDYDKIPAILI